MFAAGGLYADAAPAQPNGQNASVGGVRRLSTADDWESTLAYAAESGMCLAIPLMSSSYASPSH